MGKKKQQTTVVRTSISVPPALKKRMDQVAEDVNWSALACRAFEDKLAEIAAKKKVKSMGDVIERLRKSKQEHGTEMYKQGHADGISWARDRGEFAELQRMADMRNNQHWPDWLSGSSAYANVDGIMWTIRPELDGQRLDAEDFQDVFDVSGAYDDDYLIGFVDGAYEIWSEVEGSL